MQGISAYLLQVTAAAVICGIFKSLLGKKGGATGLVRLLCAVFMTVTVLSPLTNLDVAGWFTNFTEYGTLAQTVVEDAKLSAERELASDIKQRTEAYILDKAKSFGMTVNVEVAVTAGTVPMPSGVRIIGPVAPYAKARLSSWLQEEMGIPLEDQEWANS